MVCPFGTDILAMAIGSSIGAMRVALVVAAECGPHQDAAGSEHVAMPAPADPISRSEPFLHRVN